jgi:transaldolase
LLRDAGQSLWLDNITRELLDDGTLRRYVDDYSITGLTSNPTIFDQAIDKTSAYDPAIRDEARSGQSDEALFFELALEDLRRAADLFRPVFDATDGVDGWASIELSPLLASHTAESIAAAKLIHAQAGRPNIFVKIPGTPAGIPAIEDAIFEGVPVNVTLLFSRDQYVAAAAAYQRGIERRIAAGRDVHVASVASLFISRWDRKVADSVPPALQNRLGIAVGGVTYRAYRQSLASLPWQALAACGARPQRLLWASTGTKDPNASDTLYVEALVAPDTIDTMPEQTLRAFADHGSVRGTLPDDGGDADATLAQFAKAGIDVDEVARQLQDEGAQAFVDSWTELLRRIAGKRHALADTRQAAR